LIIKNAHKESFLKKVLDFQAQKFIKEIFKRMPQVRKMQTKGDQTNNWQSASNPFLNTGVDYAIMP